MGNYVIGVGNYVIATPSELGNYMIADTYKSVLHPIWGKLRRNVGADCSNVSAGVCADSAWAAPAAPRPGRRKGTASHA
jgi:hypothetical protein